MSTRLTEAQIRSGLRGCCGGSFGPKGFCENWGCQQIGTLLELLDVARAALTKYGRHFRDCANVQPTGYEPCTCGFDGALDPSTGAQTAPGPEAGVPKGQGYGCAVPMSPVMPTEEWQVEHDIVLSRSYVLTQADSDAVVPSPAPECHCARILPVLRRWLLAWDARGGFAYDREAWETFFAEDRAVKVLAREVLGE